MRRACKAPPTSHITHHTPHRTYHASHITPHTSHLRPFVHLTPQTPRSSHLTPHTSHLPPATSHNTPHTSHLRSTYGLPTVHLRSTWGPPTLHLDSSLGGPPGPFLGPRTQLKTEWLHAPRTPSPAMALFNAKALVCNTCNYRQPPVPSGSSETPQ